MTKKKSDEHKIGYTRISKDEDNDRESIENQKTLIKQYCEAHEIDLDEIICDNNISGYDFENRAGLTLIKQLVRDGRLNTLIVKDLSRLGRHQINILMLLEFFKDHNVRLILIGENYDSANDKNDSMLGIKAWFNEEYVKDISKKTKDNIHAIQKKTGIVSIPPYGYKKIYSMGGKKYELDPVASVIVREIYDLFFQGHGQKAIARIMSEKGYQTPKVRRYVVNSIDAEDLGSSTGDWEGSTVGRILKNENYFGELINNKTTRTKINKKQYAYNVPESEWVRHENFFPSIITKEEHLRVKRILGERKKRNYRNGRGGPHMLTGKVKCGKCEKNLVYKKMIYKNGENMSTYICSTYNKKGVSACLSHTIQEEVLKKVIIDKLKMMLTQGKVNHEIIDKEIKKRREKTFKYQSSLDNLVKRRNSLEVKIGMLLDEKFEGRISEKIANSQIVKTSDEIEKIDQQIEDIEWDREKMGLGTDELSKSQEIIEMVLSKGEIDRQVIDIMLDKIIIHHPEDQGKRPKKTVEIIWKPAFGIHDRKKSETKLVGHKKGDITHNEEYAPSGARDYGFDSRLER